MTLFLAIILVVFIFGFLVFVHESGHFIAAKMNGVYVEEFAFGFGPKLFGKKYKGTEYKINAIPLGGYVKMFGDQDAASFKQDATLKGDPRSYVGKKIWQKMIISLAGVTANIITAFFIFYFYLIITSFKPEPIMKIINYNFFGADQNEYLLYYALDKDGAAEEAGMPENAFLVKVNDKDVHSKSDIEKELKNYENKEVEVTILTSDLKEEVYKLDLGKTDLDGDVKLGVYPLSTFSLPVWDENDAQMLFYFLPADTEESVARNSGMPEEGYILELAGQRVTNRDDLEKVLNENENKTIDVKVVNSKSEENIYQVVLGSKAKDGKVKMGIYVVTKDGVDAVEPPVFYVVNYNNYKLTSGITHTYNITIYQTIGLGKVIQKAFQGDSKQLTESLATPIKVGEVVYDLISIGDFKNIINLAGLISATLAFMNMLPIPLIDGGQFFMLLIEKLRGKPLPEKFQDILGKLGLGCITLLGVVVILKDFWQVILSRIF